MMRQPYRIESITLKGVGVFEHTHIYFPQIKSEEQDAKKAEIHIFTGPNGCGKSTMLYALAGILNPEPGGDVLASKRYHGVESCVKFSFAGESGFFGVKAPSVQNMSNNIWNNNSYCYSIENVQASNVWRNKPYININEPFANLSFDYAGFAYSGRRNESEVFEVGAIQEIKISPFDNSLSFTNTVRPQVLAQWIANNRAQAALAQADDEFSEVYEYDSSLDRISKFIGEVCDIEASLKLKRKPLSVVIDLSGQPISFDTLPEGLKSIITWVTDLTLRLEAIPWKEKQDIFSQPVILFLDEVDIHLHPKWQRRILPAIQKLLPNAQVFVSTHSPFVVGSVEDAYVYRLPEPRYDICRDPSVVETITAVDSKAGKSYQYILSDVFGINEEFDVETEKQLHQFKDLIRQNLLAQQHDDEITRLADVLSEKGEELSVIVSLELRQMQRLLAKKQG